ncbi:MAG: hypothetical protein A3I78_08605 [Gammaproteobacteria bacterium RIFCSPLOWO2_02_FULL_56_15]|nr:MAG: hypothetical protein A3I78_08605 [Gammaproteobacteria bacterium RIFCSPLOWO2_02_FULL_56_15]
MFDATPFIFIHSDIHDPESGGTYTVKQFDSSRIQGKDSIERMGTILLRPVNPEYPIIEISNAAVGDVNVIAELIEVLP